MYQNSKMIFNETALMRKAKFYAEHPWVGGTKVCLPNFGFYAHCHAQHHFKNLLLQNCLSDYHESCSNVSLR